MWGFVEVGDGACEEQFVIDLGVVAGDAIGEGSSVGAPLVAQGGVLRDAEGEGEQLMPAVVGDGLEVQFLAESGEGGAEQLP